MAVSPSSTQGWIITFTAETWEVASSLDFSVVAFTPAKQRQASRIRIGAKLFPYITDKQCFAGIISTKTLAIDEPSSSPFGSPGRFPIVIKTSKSLILEPSNLLPVSTLYRALALFRGHSSDRSRRQVLRSAPLQLKSSDIEILMDRLLCSSEIE